MRNMVISRYKHSAKQRGLVWGLTTEQFVEITRQNCHYCGAPPVERDYVYRSSKRQNEQRYNGGWVCNGVDRKDNDLGYTPGNSLPCCKTCNNAKRSMPYDEFITYLERVTKFRQNGNIHGS